MHPEEREQSAQIILETLNECVAVGEMKVPAKLTGSDEGAGNYTFADRLATTVGS